MLDCTPVTPVTSPNGVTAQDSATHSRWLLHFADRDYIEVTFAPPVALADVLRQYVGAVAAVPIADPAPKPRSCSTCRHSTRFGNCGEPVAAGLAEVFRLERHPTGGEGCAVFEVRRIAAEHRVEALLSAGLLDQDDAALIRQRYDDDPQQWDRLLDDIERTAQEERR